jgi:murein DD-endopeptidase MepM/ murein hydrolase activator NlpD
VSTALRSRNALARALISLSAIALCFLALGTSAAADDGAPLPRAVPAARALPRTFSSYNDLITYATSLAADQNALDQRASDAQTELGRIATTLGTTASAPRRGGALYNVNSASISREVTSEMSQLRVRSVALTRTLQQLNAAGALSAARTPWRMPTVGEVTQPFGPTDLWVEPGRTYGGVAYAHFHDGVDIAGPWMADVVAPARGRVVFVGRMMDGAEVVVLAHDSGLVSMYAHLDAWQSPPPVAAGDEVAAGQKIGTQGLTGMVTGQHLHWTVYKSGELIDPLSLLSN